MMAMATCKIEGDAIDNPTFVIVVSGRSQNKYNIDRHNNNKTTAKRTLH